MADMVGNTMALVKYMPMCISLQAVWRMNMKFEKYDIVVVKDNEREFVGMIVEKYLNGAGYIVKDENGKPSYCPSYLMVPASEEQKKAFRKNIESPIEKVVEETLEIHAGDYVRTTDGEVVLVESEIGENGFYECAVLDEHYNKVPLKWSFVKKEAIEEIVDNPKKLEQEYEDEELTKPNCPNYFDDHYNTIEGMQPIEIMQMTFTRKEFLGFLKGNIIKYVMRAGKKAGEAAEKDLAKAARYRDWYEQAKDGKIINPRE